MTTIHKCDHEGCRAQCTVKRGQPLPAGWSIYKSMICMDSVLCPEHAVKDGDEIPRCKGGQE